MILYRGGGVQSISTQADTVGASYLNAPPNNEIWYTSTDGKIVTPNYAKDFGANIVTNTYENGKGVITFDGDVTSIGISAFTANNKLSTIKLPNKVLSVRKYAFKRCYYLTYICFGESIRAFQTEAFYQSGLKTIIRV